MTAVTMLVIPPSAGASQTVGTDLTGIPALAAQAALVVGGTTYPTISDSYMSLFTTTFAPTLINVPYPATIAPPFDGPDTLGASVTAGVKSLIGLINTTYVAGTHLVVWGISQGALVLDVTQQMLLNDPSAPPPSALTFVRVADPAQASTGMLNFAPDLALSKLLYFSMRTAPTESQYNTIVVTNEYDGFADFPDKWGPLAVLNASVGLFYRHAETAFVDLSTVPDRNITTTVNSLGATTTTYLVPASVLPLTQPLRDLGVTAPVVDAIDRILKPKIDVAYKRNDPPPSDTPSLELSDSSSPRVPSVRAAATGKRSAVSAAATPDAGPSRSRSAAAARGAR
jgi:hypothetical protein